MDGRRFLEDAIADKIDQATDRPAALQGVDRSEIRGIALGLVAAGVLRQADMDEVLATLDTRLADAGLLDVRRFALASPPDEAQRLQMVRSMARTGGPAVEPSVEIGRDVESPRLVRVVPLHDRDIATSAGHIVLVSLEVWSSFMAVRIGYLDSSASARDRMLGHQRWHGHDDGGTKYTESHSYLSDAYGCALETRVFTPAPSSDATVLTLWADALAGIDRLDVPLA